jgi:hypothetical protein
MTTFREIEEMSGVIGWLADTLNGVQVPQGERFHISACCFDISLEHHYSIVTLASKGFIGSSFALVRPQFEAYVRGLWFHHCASAADVASFKNGRLDKTFGQLLQALGQVDGFKEGMLSQTKHASWDKMNDFTHGGFRHVTRRTTGDTVQPTFEESEIRAGLRYSQGICFLAALAIAHLGDDPMLTRTLLERFAVIHAVAQQSVPGDAPASRERP